jgi:acyl-CoA thioester hydrolase
MKICCEKIRVRYAETDQMGYCYYANYLVWFEVGRSSLMREAGRSYRQVEKEGFILPVIEAHCSYKKPAIFDDLITIETRLTTLKSRKIRFDYRILRGEELLVEGYTVHIPISPQGKPVALSKDILRLFEPYCEVAKG